MLEVAEIGPGNRVLEVGAGSGYAAAVAAQLAAELCAVERHASLVSQAQQRFDKLGWPATRKQEIGCILLKNEFNEVYADKAG